MSFTHIDTL